MGRAVTKSGRKGSSRSAGRPQAATVRPSPKKPGDSCRLRTMDYRKFLDSLEPNSVDLMLTDPPYAISRKTGFQNVGKNGVERFAVSMDFGKWDHSEINLAALSEKAFRVIRGGGAAIIFYDLWKITPLAEALRKAGFVQLRFIEWLKKNPVPLNSSRNYLTNSREIAISCVKGKKPTFNNEYHNGVYEYPIPRGRVHPTQKPLKLFKELVETHSSPNDLIVDPFSGSGTTALAALSCGRRFSGCDKSSSYVEVAKRRVRDGK